jgi:hypothetical protein
MILKLQKISLKKPENKYPGLARQKEAIPNWCLWEPQGLEGEERYYSYTFPRNMIVLVCMDFPAHNLASHKS